MFLEDAAGMAFPLQQLCKLAVAGVNDLGSLKSETKPLSQAAATTQRQKLQTRALQKTAPPPVASSKPSTMAPKPLDISMPKLAAVQKLQLLLTKKAWEVGDDRGSYSNKPLRYTNAKAPRQATLENPEKLQEYATRAIQQALKKLPEQQQLHWINPETVVGQRSWYNPMRYVAGKDVLDEKEYTLGKGSTKKDIADIVALMQIGSEDQSPLMAYRPQKYANVVQPTRQAVRDYLLNWNRSGAFDTDNYEDLEENLPWAPNAWKQTADNDPIETFQLDTNQLARRFLFNRSREKAVNNYIDKHFAHLPAGQALKKANVVQPPNNYRLLPAAPNVTTTTPVQRAQNLHADKLPGASAMKSTIQDNGPISTVGNVNGNAGQGVRAGGMKLAVHKLTKLLRGQVN